jgi:hypothetical protein
MADFSKARGADAFPAEPKHVGGRKTARYDGWCTECGEDILADVDEIEQDFEGIWVHEGCAGLSR